MEFIEEIKKYSAEKVINKADDIEIPMESKLGDAPDYKEYSKDGYTDRDIIFRFKDYLPHKDLEKLNKRLNKNATEYEGEQTVCPSCGKHLDLIANNGRFCKFCGQLLSIEKIEDGSYLKKERQKLGVKQHELAKKAHLTAPRYCLLENGNATPTRKEAVALSFVFKCSVNRIYDQPTPRKKPTVTIPEVLRAYQDYDIPTSEPLLPNKAEDIEGYDNEYIYTCPFCDEEIDLSPGEALTEGLDYYEIMKERSKGNDGVFCKCCGQAIKRPVIQDEAKIFNSYKFWISRAL